MKDALTIKVDFKKKRKINLLTEAEKIIIKANNDVV